MSCSTCSDLRSELLTHLHRAEVSAAARVLAKAAATVLARPKPPAVTRPTAKR
jgi:hypothetical protein